ncbi:MAG: polyhydroxyalkanoic acid system family protein [Pseudomonadota bacterium]
MRVTLPHSLGRDEVRARLHRHAHEIADYFPRGMATVETDWPSEDVMGLVINAAGQRIPGTIEVADTEVVIEMDLPPLLSFLRGTLERAVKQNGGKLLEKD